MQQDLTKRRIIIKRVDIYFFLLFAEMIQFRLKKKQSNSNEIVEIWGVKETELVAGGLYV